MSNVTVSAKHSKALRGKVQPGDVVTLHPAKEIEPLRREGVPVLVKFAEDESDRRALMVMSVAELTSLGWSRADAYIAAGAGLAHQRVGEGDDAWCLQCLVSSGIAREPGRSMALMACTKCCQRLDALWAEGSSPAEFELEGNGADHPEDPEDHPRVVRP